MRSPRPRAASALLTLIAASGAALFPVPSVAQADPFAIPHSLTYKAVADTETGPVLAEIVIDGAKARRMVHLDGKGSAMTIEAADARTVGLPVEDGAEGPVRLETLRLYQWTYDPLRQQLKVTLFRNNDGVNFRDLTSRVRGPSESRPLTAFRIDYDVTASANASGVQAGGLFEAALIRGNLSAGSTARAVTSPAPGNPAFVRLDSSVRYLWEKKGLVATAGDFVSAGSQSQRPVRMGGIKVGTDFDLRPDLVTVPLPAFSGSVAVPTTIDLVGASRRYLTTKLEPGDFTVRNIPAQPGRGEITAVLRDSLGRERIETARFYVSRDLLAPGRSAYAVNAGFVRRRFGETSTDYGPFAASAYFRRGLSPSLTLETSAEWTEGTANLGARADFTLGHIAKATVEGRFSHDTRAGSGHLLNLGLESIGQAFGGAIGATLPGATYRDVATRLGDPAPPRRIFANAFYRIGANIQAQLSLVRSESRAEPRYARLKERTDTAAASLQLPISSRLRFYGSTEYRRVNGRGVASVSAGLSLNLGPRTRAALYARKSGNYGAAGATFSQSETRTDPFGFHVGAQVTDRGHAVNAGAAMLLPMMRAEGEVEEVDGRFAARGTARGSILLAGGTLYAKARSEMGFVLVRTGTVAGVPITLENRLVGHTNARGALLVEDVPALVPVKIDVDPDRLPAEALVKRTDHKIRVPRRAVALVEIDAVRFVPVVRPVVDAAGRPLPAALRVRAMPSGETTLTGFDGLVEINAGAEDSRLLIGTPGSGCVVELAGMDLTDDSAAPLVCVPAIIAAEEKEPDAVASATARAGPRRVARRN
ncbi:hypothetical protein N0B51_02555 [Tsuneonella sp. YG55]|uniref:Fimbrial biogenesis outer membrane usher protein n=1 Tax=Tsuneonella litorea TaxID=2976475 RepID=A0A9X2VZ80_9SPHN|nr:hypothetical protein [Tsuneonella litorea]MCT2557857.1 hypothetical protein [Tsuneonella litorea]